MLFALYDYLHYRRRSGRYERTIIKSSLMGGAFEGSLPDTVFTQLKSGDVLFVQTFGSVISWAIMYLTKSQVSHVAMYLADRRIVHATFDGVVIEPVNALYDSNTRILPVVWHIFDEKREEVEPTITSKMDAFYYDWYLVIRKGLRIIFGWDWDYFRWTFLFDLGLILLFLDIPAIVFLGFPLLTFLYPLYLLAVVVSRAFSKKLPPSQGYPSQLLNGIYNTGEGTFLFDAYHISKEIRRYRHSGVNNEE